GSRSRGLQGRQGRRRRLPLEDRGEVRRGEEDRDPRDDPADRRREPRQAEGRENAPAPGLGADYSGVVGLFKPLTRGLPLKGEPFLFSGGLGTKQTMLFVP